MNPYSGLKLMKYRPFATHIVLLVCALSAVWQVAQATDVAMVGAFPGKAVLVIDGSAPHALAAGQSQGGVKVVSVARDSAVVEVDGRRLTVQLGAQPVALSSSAESNYVILPSDSRGHYRGNGTINGRSVQYVVDTGATSVAMSASTASRLGVNYVKGVRGSVTTANGSVAVYQVTLETVTLGGISVHNVEAVVLPQEMPDILLGMSFLRRMEMKQENANLMLRQRY